MRLNLFRRILLSLVAVGAVPLLVVSYRLVGLNRSAMTEQTLRTHAVAARTTAARVGAYLNQCRGLATAVALNPVVEANPRSRAAQELVASVLQAEPNVLAVAIQNHDGEEVLRAQRRDLAETLDTILQSSERGAVRSFPEGSAQWIRIEQDLGEDRGALRIVCDAKPLVPMMSPEELGDAAQLVLADRSGGMVLGSVSSLEGFPEPLLAEAHGGKVSGAKRYEAPGEPAVLAAQSPVLESPWFVASRQPASVAERLARDALTQSAIAIGLASAMAALLSLVAFRTIVKPVRNLVRAQRRLAGLSDETIPFENEIDDLRESFQALEQRVRERDRLDNIFLGRFQVLEMVGRGTMGTVYQAWDPRLKRVVALKTIPMDANRGGWGPAQLMSSLRKEAVTVAQFSHPNIVAVFDLQDTDDVAFIAMEFIDGTSLDHLLTSGALSVDQTVPLGVAVADALAAAHERGFVHHDVKPANVLLGKNGSIKVSDFGVSQMLESVGEDSKLIFGTPGYLPPETLLGEGYDERGDLFALGVLMYRCLTGETPYPMKGASLVESILGNEPVPPHVRDKSVPQELSELILSLLHSDHDKRPSDARTVAERLKDIAARNDFKWQPSEKDIDASKKQAIGDPLTFGATEPVDLPGMG